MLCYNARLFYASYVSKPDYNRIKFRLNQLTYTDQYLIVVAVIVTAPNFTVMI